VKQRSLRNLIPGVFGRGWGPPSQLGEVLTRLERKNAVSESNPIYYLRGGPSFKKTIQPPTRRTAFLGGKGVTGWHKPFLVPRGGGFHHLKIGERGKKPVEVVSLLT